MSVAREVMVTKLFQFYNVFCQFAKKVVLRLSEYGDVIETQTIRIVPPMFFSKLGPCPQLFYCSPFPFQ